MKTYLIVLITSLLSVSCHGQKNDANTSEAKSTNDSIVDVPKGTWQVDKTFDENGNLIRYDSIYSWSSDKQNNDLSMSERDSVVQSYNSRFFKHFSQFEDDGFDAIFSQDSLFSHRFFNDDFFGSDFGTDFMDIDRIRQQMRARQKAFLEKYQSEFIKPEGEN